MVTETNSVSYNPGKQTTSLVNSLFLTDQVMTWLENGVTNVDWWAIHNSPFDGNVDPALYGNYEFGDYGILSRGLTSANGAVEPPAETPLPAYYGLQMLSRLGHQARSQPLAASSSTAARFDPRSEASERQDTRALDQQESQRSVRRLRSAEKGVGSRHCQGVQLWPAGRCHSDGLQTGARIVVRAANFALLHDHRAVALNCASN